MTEKEKRHYERAGETIFCDGCSEPIGPHNEGAVDGPGSDWCMACCVKDVPHCEKCYSQEIIRPSTMVPGNFAGPVMWRVEGKTYLCDLCGHKGELDMSLLNKAEQMVHQGFKGPFDGPQ